ncbi:universal stress protein [Natronolimnohabitans sp. A-GB9]|uniref:universal stress protein n=1 Tax=Natronolimnohabitans sp. A-GB9 TaxID=3069757 RepID=UPI0027B1D98E|nr:universal stress protein [Natronolimnohabitans sp. A-GB9]MDQ2052432.1 universal stress protein [Natronolimnohabitans sp. A-GB9]
MTDDDRDEDEFESILVATDGSDAANAALERALDLAERTGATVDVLSVVDTSSNPMRFGVTDVAELHRTTETLVDEIVATVAGREVEIHGAIRRGRPVDVILAYASENELDVIVVGRTGRGSVTEALLGSTADRLIRQASVPVIVVPDDADDEDESVGLL